MTELNRIREELAGNIVKRGNEILRERFPEDANRGVHVLTQLLQTVAPEHQAIQDELAGRIIYRPPCFMLARDNRLRQAAADLAAVLARVRARLAGSEENKDLLAAIDAELEKAGVEPRR